MAYNPNLPAGTYRAKALQADCFPTKNGNGLMLGVEWVVTQGECEGSQLSGNICLIDGSGNITSNYKSVREWAKSWNGIDTDYFKGHFGEWDVEIVVERKMIDVRDDQGNVTQKEVPEVKWVNDPNGHHGKAIQAGDHRALGAKFGAKLRAAAASNPAPQQKPPMAGQASHTKPSDVPPPATPPDEGEQTAQDLMAVAWETLKAKNGTLGKEELKAKWFNLIKNHYDGPDIRQAPREVWEAVLSDINDDIPF